MQKNQVVKQDIESWNWGFKDGLDGEPAHPAPERRGLDGLSYASGYIEGKAKREKSEHVFDASPRTE